VEVHHLDGREENIEPENLAWACRSCNTALGIAFKHAGLGRLTRQYNPKRPGARTLGQWVTAVLSMRGEGPMEPGAAVELIHATPAERRSEFAMEIWRRRRKRGTARQR